MKIDFFARRTHFVDHMVPVWRQLESERGQFFVPEAIADHARKRGVDVVALKARGSGIDVRPPRSENAMLVCAYGDLTVAHRADPRRKFIMMEHGVGITYGPHPGYAGGKGMRKKVSLFLAPNAIVFAKTFRALPGLDQVVIGTPKLDPFVNTKSTKDHKEKPVVCISFHWNGSKVQPEAGNAFGHFRRALPDLAVCGEFKLIGHGHPREINYFAREYEKLGIEVVRDFDEVMERADLYVCDNSSTIYEFLVTGKPVVLMNAPQYRRNVHWGIRFWEYTDIGPMMDMPIESLPFILHALKHPEYWQEQRERAVQDLFPYQGCSARRAAEAIREWIVEKSGS
ncbi:MAG TPA: hypothetical protein VFC02_22595 [Anaerolineales bacterium]|nr:hypothetical protein [Anaerolineales bacterium]